MPSPTISVADTINTWARERLATGAVARNTDAYNQVFDALPDLITALDPAASAPAETSPSKTDPAP